MTGAVKRPFRVRTVGVVVTVMVIVLMLFCQRSTGRTFVYIWRQVCYSCVRTLLLFYTIQKWMHCTVIYRYSVWLQLWNYKFRITSFNKINENQSRNRFQSQPSSTDLHKQRHLLSIPYDRYNKRNPLCLCSYCRRDSYVQDVCIFPISLQESTRQRL